ncbi:MAG: hypothetical protein PHY34_01480 [Patescibacteria group bacterium]|nr:hypothetical protein [Patescibacteria group bacterium]MDD5715108.1 hypothetical protein [Patescibacteria group bacterium]
MSLAEMLTTIFILVLITVLLVTVYFMYTNVYKVQTAYNQLNTEAAITIDSVTRTIRVADQVLTSATINGTEYTTDQDTLVLGLLSIDANGDIIADTNDQIAYYRDPLDPSLLKSDVQTGAGSSRSSGIRVIGEYISTLIFNYNNTDYANVDKIETIFESRNTASNKVLSITVQNTTTLRNN